MFLHIHNGDATADIARESSLPGKHFAWREALMEGPAPAGVNGAEWRRRRALHLSKGYGVEQEKCEQELLKQEQELESFAGYDEVVLWFEHDLFCQVNLAYLLDWFSRQQLGNTKLSLVCIDSFPGKDNFRGLGELNTEELTSLFPSRQPVSRKQFQLASSAWEAYRSPDPRDIETLLQTDTDMLPFLAPALRAHQRRFPSTTNGLGRIENRGLQLVSSGLKNFGDLFRGFCELEPIYGLGDAQFWLSLQRLSHANQPLLSMSNGEGVSPDAALEITELGRAVSEGKGDFVLLNGIDCWLGGVYLSEARNLWRWDEETEKVVLTQISD